MWDLLTTEEWIFTAILISIVVGIPTMDLIARVIVGKRPADDPPHDPS